MSAKTKETILKTASALKQRNNFLPFESLHDKVLTAYTSQTLDVLLKTLQVNDGGDAFNDYYHLNI